jgi:hypothetical protein
MNPIPSGRQKLESKITFLQQQLDSLDQYLPDTYQYLMEQMDSQQVLLKRLEVQDHFAAIDSSHSTLRSCSALEST